MLDLPLDSESNALFELFGVYSYLVITAWDERGGFINDKKGGEPVEFREMCRMETILEHELLDSTTEYTQKKNWAAGLATKSEEDWETLDLMWRSSMWDYFTNLTGSCWTHNFDPLSPLQHAKFEPWRRYGFAIWSTARIPGYGLLLPTGMYPCGLEIPYYEAWRNLLSKDEREVVDKENKRWDTELGR
ncbi:hypothetical protein NA56DRAFT_699122 [Hyaloscypha hepaticicola]|uniref:Uncharacterized protein n=1 Tax=Hyaloscypha hepaticicola TaxID=2082293 RepID=A0A2J6QIE6_9HELO|nr:hypothetical protein NA56DRAFT_699122 [Hyaloscypha hepaticicola]